MATGGTNYKSSQNSKTPYMDLYSAFEKQVKSKGDEYKQGLEKQYDVSREQVEQDYGEGTEEQYVNYMQQKKRLPEQLRTMGLGGGAAESSLIKLKSAYGKGLGELASSRGESMRGLEQSKAQALTDYELSQEQKLQDAYANYMAQQVAYDEQLKADEMNTFLDNYQSTYTTTSSIDKAISDLMDSSDWNAESKISYLKGLRSVLSSQEKETSSGYTGGGNDEQTELEKYLALQEAFTGASANVGSTPTGTTSSTTYGTGGVSSGTSKAYDRR